MGFLFNPAGKRVVQPDETFMLYGTSPLDPATWIAAAATMVVAAMAAAVIPAFRAARVDPMIAIQAD